MQIKYAITYRNRKNYSQFGEPEEPRQTSLVDEDNFQSILKCPWIVVDKIYEIGKDVTDQFSNIIAQ